MSQRAKLASVMKPVQVCLLEQNQKVGVNYSNIEGVKDFKNFIFLFFACQSFSST
jgi:hypothetical protein